MSTDDGVRMDGDGLVDMYTDGTAQQMNAMSAEGDRLQEAWNTIRATLPAPGTFGHGLIGDAFNRRTSEVDTSIRTAADSVPVFYRDLSVAGQNLVKAYVARDAEAANFILVQLS
ncbi:hypothetical protein [Amycolatopsis sp. NPDC052450]|uniref:hypothetical protein n=1 Tax=Amycolatopsis sp. NPDC052450 TaxID=3363937 RepID=UPI0037C58868